MDTMGDNSLNLSVYSLVFRKGLMIKETILKVLVGSRAHGLATDESDYDYRGVFVRPTEEILSLNYKPKNTSWIEGSEDNTSWEIKHFLIMATKCNPTILECFHAPVVYSNIYGDKIRDLFDSVWNKTDLVNSAIGYGINQRKKFLENKDDRRPKYACAYLRTLYQAWCLLDHGEYPINLSGSSIYQTAKRFKNGDFEVGEVIQFCCAWQEKLELAAEKYEDKVTDFNRINDFLINVRGCYW